MLAFCGSSTDMRAYTQYVLACFKRWKNVLFIKYFSKQFMQVRTLYTFSLVSFKSTFFIRQQTDYQMQQLTNKSLFITRTGSLLYPISPSAHNTQIHTLIIHVRHPLLPPIRSHRHASQPNELAVFTRQPTAATWNATGPDCPGRDGSPAFLLPPDWESHDT